ncbi:SLATT domain-containing protein [Vibrio splendidus]
MPEFVCVLNSWRKRCKDARDGHYKRAETLFDRAQFLGYVLIYSTVFVTVFSFFSLNTPTEIFLGITKQHVVVLVGCIAAVISGIVTQARYGERAEMHRSSGARYANLSRSIEALQIKINAGLIDKTKIEIESNWIITEWNNLSEDSLLTPHNESKSKLMFHGLFALMFALIFFLVAV